MKAFQGLWYFETFFRKKKADVYFNKGAVKSSGAYFTKRRIEANSLWVFAVRLSVGKEKESWQFILNYLIVNGKRKLKDYETNHLWRTVGGWKSADPSALGYTCSTWLTKPAHRCQSIAMKRMVAETNEMITVPRD